jgi:hypothetical protein
MIAFLSLYLFLSSLPYPVIYMLEAMKHFICEIALCLIVIVFFFHFLNYFTITFLQSIVARLYISVEDCVESSTTWLCRKKIQVPIVARHFLE